MSFVVFGKDTHTVSYSAETWIARMLHASRERYVDVCGSLVIANGQGCFRECYSCRSLSTSSGVPSAERCLICVMGLRTSEMSGVPGSTTYMGTSGRV